MHKFILVLLASALVGCDGNASGKLRVGAINWDCSVPASTYFGGYQTRSLGPEKFRDRTPYYAKVLRKDGIDYPIRSLAEYEVEMRYAIRAGIDYFAYCWYDDQPFGGRHVSTSKAAVADEHLHELVHARRYHLQSELRRQLGFCAILVCCGPYTDEGLRELVSAMKDPSYETVDGRPLVYLFSSPWRDPLNRLVRFCHESGVPRPFSVVMSNHDIPKGDYVGIDAFSAYACTSSCATYEKLAERSLTNNVARSNHHKPIIPTFTVGWDPSSRVERPAPWCSYGNGPYHSPATGSQILAAAEGFASWLKANSAVCVPNQMLTFAWNEFEEGGWICPTWTTQGPDVSRIEAFAKSVRLMKAITK